MKTKSVVSLHVQPVFAIILSMQFLALTQGQAQSCVMTCPLMDEPVGIFLDKDCEDTLTIDLLGVTTGDCLGPFTIEIMDNGMSFGDIVTADMIGDTFMVVVTSETEQQNCMASITVFDKMPPMFTCPDDMTVGCTTDPASIEVSTEEDVMDCSDVTIYTNDELDYFGDCQGDFISKITRTYIVVDEYGNSTSCTQMIFFEPLSLDDVVFPPDLKGQDALDCFPPPDTSPAATGYPEIDGFPILNGLICNISATYSDETASLCSGGYKIFRTWVVTDWCNGNATIDSIQIIEIADKTPPEVDAPDTLVVSAGPDCLADVLAPPAEVQEDCSDEIDVRIQGSFGTIQGNGGLIEDLSLGFHTVIYIATNDCNAEGRDTMIVHVIDDTPPIAICKSAVAIPLLNDGMVTVWASSFDGGSTDNCGPVYFKVRRMDTGEGFDCFANNNASNQFDDVIKFCCDDVGDDNLMIILRVYDVQPVPGIVSNEYLAGHFSECMLRVEIQDKTPPMIECPTDLTISCEFDFDPDNLFVFGDVVTDPEDREEICIDDPGNPNTFGLTCVGLDGLAKDNCDVTVSHSPAIEIIDNCGTGEIRRTFTATDPGGLMVSCEQTITIINYLPFNEDDDIIWAPDFHTTDICQIDLLDPSDLPPPYNGPIVNEDECELVAATYKDLVFDFSINHEACFKILRTWTVIDWCQYEPGGNTGIWTDIQVIKVANTVGPEIELEDDAFEICTDDEACGPGSVQLAASAADDCSGPDALRWSVGVDHDNNGSLDQVFSPIIGDEVLIDTELPLGTHRILYSVEDFCGNVTTEEQYITMVSCKPPSAKCRNLTTTLMPVDTDGDNEADWGMVTLWASDVDAGSDHVCGNPVQVAFSSDPSDISRVFDCSDLGENFVELWVIDDQGHTDFCTVIITIQDNAEVCPSKPVQRALISGQVKTPSAENVPGVPVTLNGSNLSPQLTDASGHYAFPPMQFGGEYRIEPHLNTDHKKGVSTLDLILLQKHLLGIQLLDNPYKMIAADANHSQTLSAMDIVVLRRLILGITEELPGNTSWRFVDAGYQFIDAANPLQEPFPESYHIPILSSDMDIDFVAVKVGDLNGSAMSAAAGSSVSTRSTRALSMYLRDQLLKAGETVELQIICDELEQVEAVQFTLEWDPALIEVTPAFSNGLISSEHMNTRHLSDGMLPVSWTKYDGEVREGQKNLMTLQVRAKVNGSLYDSGLRAGNRITATEALMQGGRTVDPRLNILPVADIHEVMVVYQNRPNPFSRKTMIPLSLPMNDLVRVDIYNAEGKLVHQEQVTLQAGYNEIMLDVAQLGQPGLYACTISSSSEIRTLRMIVAGE